MKIIIAIVGAAGTGKDTVADLLNKTYGYKRICSYTTRPMRDGEVNGREHFFVKDDEVPDPDKRFAYTVYGDYQYWTTFEQMSQEIPNVYVIDEDGLKMLYENNSNNEWAIIGVNVIAPKSVRRERGVTEERMSRDEGRELLPNKYYKHRIVNTGTIDVLKERIKCIVQSCYEYPSKENIEKMIKLSLQWSDECYKNPMFMHEYCGEEGRIRYVQENW